MGIIFKSKKDMDEFNLYLNYGREISQCLFEQGFIYPNMSSKEMLNVSKICDELDEEYEKQRRNSQ